MKVVGGSHTYNLGVLVLLRRKHATVWTLGLSGLLHKAWVRGLRGQGAHPPPQGMRSHCRNQGLLRLLYRTCKDGTYSFNKVLVSFQECWEMWCWQSLCGSSGQWGGIHNTRTEAGCGINNSGSECMSHLFPWVAVCLMLRAGEGNDTC